MAYLQCNNGLVCIEQISIQYVQILLFYTKADNKFTRIKHNAFLKVLVANPLHFVNHSLSNLLFKYKKKYNNL